MFKALLRGVQIAGALWVFSVTGPAAAQPADPAKQAAAESLATFFLSAMDIEAIVSGDFGRSFTGMEGSRPEWEPMIKQAFLEQFAKDRPYMVTILARQFSNGFSKDELVAGAVLMGDPALRAAMKSSEPPARPAAETMRVMGTPAGKAFVGKMGDLDKLIEPMKAEFIGGIVPGVFQRFGTMAQGFELKRRAANGLPPPLAD